ncbi:MAG: cation:dicarboxylase symporter family transporter, partial [Planctomycetaceae bacterium]|nr:cation:dicarboxylase symporter family transporter [Planctomycetaceae bacterium]
MSQSPDKISPSPKPKRTGCWIALGLGLGVVCGILFGEYCEFLQVVGRAYVGFLQMTVLPYLAVSLVAKLGRLNAVKARQLGARGFVALLCLWGIGILIVTLASAILPPMEGASFFQSANLQSETSTPDFFATFIPTNIFRSLSEEFVPAVVVFCVFCGIALISLPEKEPLLNFLDLCSQVISRINLFLVRLAPIGLFALTASAAGTLHIDELSRLQAYLLLYGFVCLITVFGVLPLFVCSLTRIGYWDLLRAAQEPLYTAIATGKLFVALPQIVEKCEWLINQEAPETHPTEEATANVLVPLAYPFPHLGKILSFVFISFSAWYVGQELTPTQTLVMAGTGTVSSFASPLVTIPYLLDQFQLPQDLIGLFILPGFMTMRLGDMVGVMHMIALTVIVY